MSDDAKHSSAKPWWGTFEIHPHHCGRWRIGPLSLWIRRLPGEWRIGSEYHDDPLDNTMEIELPIASDATFEPANVQRYAGIGNGVGVSITPLMANRPVVSRPETPFNLLPDNEATLYVGTPLWLRISLEPEKIRLHELPIFRPTDTWFGPRTQDGELCYASRTFCRLVLDEISFRPHRATTAVQVVNHSDSLLPLERMLLPAPRLGLYQLHNGQLWTADVTLEHVSERELARFKVAERPLRGEGEARRVSRPRLRHSPGAAVRAFGSLFR